MMLVSILDNDFYKFTMQNAVVKLFPRAKARYAFINRGEHRFPPGFDIKLREAVHDMAQLSLTSSERVFLETMCPYLDPGYFDFLSGFRFNPDEVSIHQEGEHLKVVISGLWYRTILWEIPILAMISQLWFEMTDLIPDSETVGLAKVQQKIEHYRSEKLKVADFGTRRRYSYLWQDKVVGTLKRYGQETFTGSSNVHLAHRHQIKPLGTHAHEWFMFHAACYGFKIANRVALNNWVNVYRGDLGIALTDTFTTNVFFASFDKMFAKLFDGLRHDSGDPVEFAQKTIQHYQKFGIDPETKTIIFSDALDPTKVDRIKAFCEGKIGMSFGIGTNFTNDIGLKPMNMVIKMTEASPNGDDHWVEVIKLSDVAEKNTGDTQMLALARKVLDLD